MMRLKPDLPLRDLGSRQFVVGLAIGALFAFSMYLVSVSIAQSMMSFPERLPLGQVEIIEFENEIDAFMASRGYSSREPRPVPEIVGPTEVNVPRWFMPFWAGLSASLGHSLTLWVWFGPPIHARSLREKRIRRRAIGGIATGLSWIGLAPYVLITLWFIYYVYLYSSNIWVSAFGLPGEVEPNPFIPFAPWGLFAFLFIVFVVLEPWRMLQFAYRCRWEPLVALAITSLIGVLIWLLAFPLIPTLPS